MMASRGFFLNITIYVISNGRFQPLLKRIKINTITYDASKHFWIRRDAQVTRRFNFWPFLIGLLF